VGVWSRKFVLREVLTFVGRFSCQRLHSLLLQVILYGMFWLVWANCALLLHLFDYSSIFEMPALPLLYVLLSLVLVGSSPVCYFYPIWVMSVWNSCFSRCKGTDRASSPQEKEPLLQTETPLHGETFSSEADTNLPLQGMVAPSSSVQSK